MMENIKKWYNNYEVTKRVKEEKNLYVGIANSLKTPNANKKILQYIPILQNLVTGFNDLFYDTSISYDSNKIFAQLMIVKIRDYYVAVIFLTSVHRYSGIIPIMRSLCEIVFLLKYVEKYPEYISDFMANAGRGIDIRNIKKKVDDKNLSEYYSNLSDFTHVNPVSFKMHYYEFGDKKLISQIPFRDEEFSEGNIRSLIGLMIESFNIIKEIYSGKIRSN